MKLLVNIIFLLAGVGACGQNPEGFDQMCREEINANIPYVQIDAFKTAIQNEKVFILDTREANEYKTSHIARAINVGYDHFNISALQFIPKDAQIYVYCSIGWRSDKIGNRLIEAGYKNVYNLYGGIFNWFNQGNPVFNDKKQTNSIHGYNKEWAKWLNPEKGKIVLN